jgi:hypothetical protein
VLNAALYEGVRYGFLHVTSFGSPFRIGALRRVCQILPVNYLGAFASSDPMLNRFTFRHSRFTLTVFTLTV